MFTIVIAVASIFLVGNIDTARAQKLISKFDCAQPGPGKIDADEASACGIANAGQQMVNCNSGLVCSSNEFNSCPSRVCLTPVGGKCYDDKNCEGGSFCDPSSTTCVITSQTEQATASDLRDTIRRAINIILGFLGILTVILVLYGGFVWLTAAGSEDNVKKGRDILIWAAIGAIVISIAWTISSYILNVASKVG